jgi:DNA-binding transcriptional regulator YiaG
MKEIVLKLRLKTGAKSDEALARLLKVSLGSIAKWKNGERKPGAAAMQLINEILAS